MPAMSNVFTFLICFVLGSVNYRFCGYNEYPAKPPNKMRINYIAIGMVI